MAVAHGAQRLFSDPDFTISSYLVGFIRDTVPSSQYSVLRDTLYSTSQRVTEVERVPYALMLISYAGEFVEGDKNIPSELTSSAALLFGKAVDALCVAEEADEDYPYGWNQWDVDSMVGTAARFAVGEEREKATMAACLTIPSMFHSLRSVSTMLRLSDVGRDPEGMAQQLVSVAANVIMMAQYNGQGNERSICQYFFNTLGRCLNKNLPEDVSGFIDLVEKKRRPDVLYPEAIEQALLSPSFATSPQLS